MVITFVKCKATEKGSLARSVSDPRAISHQGTTYSEIPVFQVLRGVSMCFRNLSILTPTSNVRDGPFGYS